jgi:hypothetical protein
MQKQSPAPERFLLSHELSNDLRVVLKRCDMLEALITDPEMSKHLNLIRAAAEHMVDRIAQDPAKIVSQRA